jgi:AP-3 complex subunit beta
MTDSLSFFQDYIKDPDRRFAADTVAAIGLCAKRLMTIPTTCLDGLLALVRQESFAGDFESADGEAGVLVQAVMSIQTMIERDPLRHEKVHTYHPLTAHLIRTIS